ncbi:MULTISPECIES: VanZ family protein [unclassified Gemella]|uniref:VanZ family protein n=1 Tax=unclassified Gemella TaxID=2624949 RepID=UPI0015D0A74A|nr:VanZ family protein [Gemella sp. GL1.1]NYS27393.1 VanZ family protein [Gemella sp. GL1]
MLKILFNRKFSLIMVIFLMGTIFYFSHQIGYESNQLSNNVLIRKLAHITEYAVLGFFVYIHLLNCKINRVNLVAGAVSIVYAASDEYHQTFIEGRSGNIIDIFIDAIGVMIGIGIASYFVEKIVI